MFNRRRFLLSAAATAPAIALHAQEKTAAQEKSAATAEPGDDSLPAPIAALTDRTKDVVPITVEERESRLDLARELMGQYKLNAIVMTTGSTLRYFSGVRWGQSERLFAYVIPQAGSPFFVCPAMERDRLNDSMMTKIPGTKDKYKDAIPEHDSTQIFLWQENEDPYAIMKRVLAEVFNLGAGTIGIDEQASFGHSSNMMRAAPAIKFVDAVPVTAGCRSIKTPAELALMKLANQITFDVYKAVYLSCGPGDTANKFTDLVAKAYARCGVHGDVSCNVGPNSAIPHGSGQPQVIREGEMVMIDDGCQVEGYWSDITRSFVYGKPTDQQRTVFETVYNAQSAALGAAGPGVPMQIVDGAARQVIVKAGYGPGYDFFFHRVGHGIGMDGHEWPYLVEGNQQKLVAGMTFSDEPGIYIRDKFGVRLEDCMFITDNGAEMFTRQSPSLLDPFAIPAVLPDKTKDAPADAAPTDAKPSDAKPSDTPPTTPK